jgi:putative hydrolase of the HAD superfamily
VKYKHIFFDLDHTLWDYDANASAALRELFEKFELMRFPSITPDLLIETFFSVNYDLWDLYNKHQIQRKDIRQRRFPTIFKRMGLEFADMPETIEKDYISLSPTKPKTFPNAHEVLEYLEGKYKLHIITNGFDDIQDTKMTSSGIKHHFDVIVTSESANQRKPSPDIFHLAMDRAGAAVEESIMIGDNLGSDIEGAKNVGMDHVWFNPNRTFTSIKVQHEIMNLIELKSLL